MTDTIVPNDQNNQDIRISPGKVPPNMLGRLLTLPRKRSPNLIVGPSQGEDAAVIRLGGTLQVVTSDPITFPTSHPGYYAVHVNANDVAVMGGQPTFFTLTIIAPPQTPFKEIERVWQQVIRTADELNIILIGGHSEVSPAVNTTILSMTMIGELITTQPLKTGNGQIGDVIIQVNPLAIEGTSILVSENRTRLEALMTLEEIERAGRFFLEPGLSVVEPALFVARRFPVRAMHDPTEGGLATGLKEIAQASGTGLNISLNKLIVDPLTTRICQYLDYDPLGLISSGCLVFTVPAIEADVTVKSLINEGYQTAAIGSLTPDEGEYWLENDTGRRVVLPSFDVDELARK